MHLQRTVTCCDTRQVSAAASKYWTRGQCRDGVEGEKKIGPRSAADCLDRSRLQKVSGMEVPIQGPSRRA
jgi:hypothetical protein